ncbi:hypothetical protein I7L49_07155 [Neisseria meningitidis]|uniref:hypothetical protein n=1 Tax=Neisseria meningitidis TaxID=487 RepID=UPI0002E16389|nr:hypothetical protein [Neisseria meningitidis]MBH2336944.1 hypothetical protein [Neisseria meningitidis]MBH5543936.1 hypothetical protein [Neisseria meningitidis]MBH5851432.1 hypothetical protein [Neisseria meningitidis]MBH5951099.1 hypothetical protein [Neisseria meningitidis]MBH5953275.1 hypothetical protein [Neisseria meningitidis]
MPALAENPFVRFLFLGFRAISKPSFLKKYSGLNLNQYGVASPCRTICTVCGFVALS